MVVQALQSVAIVEQRECVFVAVCNEAVKAPIQLLWKISFFFITMNQVSRALIGEDVSMLTKTLF